MPRLPLALHLFLCLGCAATLPALLLGLTLSARWEEDKIVERDHQTVLAADALAREVGALIEARAQAVEALARQVEASGTLEPSYLQEVVTAQRQAAGVLSFMYIGSVDGRSLAVDPPYDDQGAPNAGTDYSDRDYYQAVLKARTTVISRPQVGKRTKSPNIQIAAPIRDSHGGLIAFAEGTVDLAELETVAEQVTQGGPDLHATILDAAGRALADENPDVRSEMRDLSRLSLFAPALADDDAIRVGPDARGVLLRAVAEPVTTRALNWTATVGQPAADVEMQAAQARGQTFTAVALALAMGFILAALLSKLLAAPIVGLAAVVSQVGRGNLSRLPSPARRWDAREPAELVRLVGQMVVQLRARTEHLEQSVTERTKALQATNEHLDSSLRQLESARRQAESANRILDLLARASSEFARSLDYEKTMQCVADFPVPELVDCCIVALVRDGAPCDVAIGPAGAGYADVASEAIRKQIARPESIFQRVLASGRTELARSCDEIFGGSAADVLEGVCSDSGERPAALVTALRSSGGRVLGVLCFIAPPSKRPFEEREIRVAEEVAQRAAAGIDNALLFSAAQEEIQERRRAEEALSHQALHDGLTGLPNRTLLNQRLRAALHPDSSPRGVALLLLDLNSFKDINDSLGHEAGDRLLQAVATRLQAVLRSADLVARLGGDEFALIADAHNAEDARRLAARISETLEAPFSLYGRSVSVKASVGIALYPDDGTEPDSLLRRADIAMYTAKRAGKGFALYTAAQEGAAEERLALAGDLRRGIEAGEFVLHYQPKIRFTTGTVAGVEALVRWQHPRLGLLGPDRFIPLAEEIGVIRSITELVLGQALSQIRAWRDRGLDMRLAVNLSTQDLADPGLERQVMTLLAASGTAPSSLVLEVTESSLLINPKQAFTVLDRLRSLGTRISLDDFGTGYASLSYLQQLPATQLKIDKSFVGGMVNNPRDQSIVRSLIWLGHSLGLQVVAEGVEDRETMDLLEHYSCDGAQGYYFGRPLPAEQIPAWLEQSGFALDSLLNTLHSHRLADPPDAPETGSTEHAHKSHLPRGAARRRRPPHHASS